MSKRSERARNYNPSYALEHFHARRYKSTVPQDPVEDVPCRTRRQARAAVLAMAMHHGVLSQYSADRWYLRGGGLAVVSKCEEKGCLKARKEED